MKAYNIPLLMASEHWALEGVGSYVKYLYALM